MLQSLRARLFVSHLAVIALVFILTAAVAFVPLEKAQAHLETQRLESVMGPLAVQTSYMIRSPRYTSEDVQNILNLQAGKMGARLLLLDRQGQVVHDTGRSRPLTSAAVNVLKPFVGQLAVDEAALQKTGKSTNEIPTRNLGNRNGERIFLAAVPLVPNRIIAVLTPARPLSILRQLLWPLTLAALVGLAGAVLATIFLSRSIAQPITRLTRAADAVAAGDLDRRVPGEGYDEVGRLVHSFNTMVARLQATYDSQRRLLANVAHDLRTPLTSIQGYALALHDGVIATEEERQAALATISEESERINRLVIQILQLARLESGQAQANPTTVDMGGLIGRVVRRYQLEAENAGVEVSGSAAPNSSVVADEALIDQAIDNLVRNALEHTPRGGRITINAMPVIDPVLGLSRLRIRVVDTGEGIPPEELPHIFDRFHQVEPNRTPSRPGGGFGLGLAIVREIVAGHNGNVSVESQLGKGTTFIIDLPRGAGESPASGRGTEAQSEQRGEPMAAKAP